MMSLFKRLKKVIDTFEKFRVLDATYEAIPPRNFSSHLFQHAPERFAVIEMRDVLWSEWGNPERILSGLEKFGRRRAAAQDPLPFLYVG